MQLIKVHDKKIEFIFLLMIVKAFAGYILPWGMQVGPTQACMVKVVVHNLIKNEWKKKTMFPFPNLHLINQMIPLQFLLCFFHS